MSTKSVYSMYLCSPCLRFLPCELLLAFSVLAFSIGANCKMSCFVLTFSVLAFSSTCDFSATIIRRFRRRYLGDSGLTTASHYY